MLVEVICDQFMENGEKRPPIRFHEGLNAIIGNDEGGNSIGKSTFLMILDFVFGGKDYVRKLQVIQNILKDHEIKFQFKFKDTPFYFSRSTADYLHVHECDENYLPTGKILSLDDYNSFLRNSYGIPASYGKFREITGRFLRIYNRSNMNERRPLSIDGEKDETTVAVFLAIMGLKKDLAPYEKVSKEASEEYDYLKKAKVHGDKPTAKNKTELKELQLKLKNITEELKSIDEGLLSTDSIKLEGLAEIDSHISKLLYQRSKVKTRLRNLESSGMNSLLAFPSDFDKLLDFFPNANIRKLKEVEGFHNAINGILDEQITNERIEMQKQLEIINSEIEKARKERNDFQGDLRITSVSSVTRMNNILSRNSEKESIERQIENTQALNQAEEAKKTYEAQLKERRKELSKDIIAEINSSMREMNEMITAPNITNPPEITISENGKNYIFHTPKDQGRGTQYKGMVIFDLTMLKKTILPVLIHDSDLLQPVAYNPVDGIVKQYEKSTKQIFVAVDKLSSYNKETQRIFREKKVLELYPGGGELFGRALNTPDQTN